MTSERLKHYKAEFEKLAQAIIAEHGGEVDRVSFSTRLENGKWSPLLSVWYKSKEGDDGLYF